jgi:DNA-binding NarL/FixJ family response regulator
VWTVVGDLVPLGARQPRRRVVVTFTLPAEARRLLSEVLGTGFDLVDIKLSEGDEDIVLVASSSRQLTGKLRAAFPDAALLVVEMEDIARGVELGGQVLRTLDAGADGYFVARSVDELASIVGQASGRIGSASATEPAALTSGASDELGDVLDALLVQRQNGDSALGRESRSRSDGI